MVAINPLREHLINGIKEPQRVYQDSQGLVTADTFVYKGVKVLAIFYENHTNPNKAPMHPIGTGGLNAFDAAIVAGLTQNPQAVLFYERNDPNHAGGDLGETRDHLNRDINNVEFAANRLRLGPGRRRQIGNIKQPTYALIYGNQFGGSTEKALWADRIIAASTATMSLSEVYLSLIAGWDGAVRLAAKTPLQNVKTITMLGEAQNVDNLYNMNVVDKIIEVTKPSLRWTGPGSLDDFRASDDQIHQILFPQALDYIVATLNQSSPTRESDFILPAHDTVDEVVARRSNPDNYKDFAGKKIKEVKDAADYPGRAMSPESFKAMRVLLAEIEQAGGVTPDNIDSLSKKEAGLDLELYKQHPDLLLIGIEAALTGTVAHFVSK